MVLINQEALKERSRRLGMLNGIEMLYLSLHAVSAVLEVHFFNKNYLSDILADPSSANTIFQLSGGHRIKAGQAYSQIDVTKIEAYSDPTKPVLILIVEPIGDYSTYTLSINRNRYPKIDPMFSTIDFKFRPGCFNINCRPDWIPSPAPRGDPAIDYLAKDYDSFKHTMINAMMERVPGWQPTSEADLDQVLLELFCASADELSDFQDRVMNEAYLSSARKRVSLARHSRLMDYHIHQGNQASTWIALKIRKCGPGIIEEMDIPDTHTGEPLYLTVWAGSEDMKAPSSAVFMTHAKQNFNYLFNEMYLYTWSGSIRSLEAGSSSVDLKANDENSANIFRDAIRKGDIKHLLLQEMLNPATGEERGRDPRKRQILRLLKGNKGAKTMQDPLTMDWFVRVRWDEEDRLRYNYCFTVECSGIIKENVSCFFGNVVEVYHGREVKTIFKEPGTDLENGEYYFERIERKIQRINKKGGRDNNLEWVVCRLPENPLAYKKTLPGGDKPPKSTLEIKIKIKGSIIYDLWNEQISLIHSKDGDGTGNHFVVETNEEANSLVRFGNGVNGKKLPKGSEVVCLYQVSGRVDGNVGADTIINFNNNVFEKIERCWNPFDVTDGRDPEPVAEIIRRAPEAYRSKQLRAVTLKDYIDRAEELPEVQRASARYVWTGSWRGVQIAIDPRGTDELKDEVRERIMLHLDAVRLIGEDLEIRPPRFVPLEINVSLCIHPEYWPEDIKYILEQEFSDKFTPEGKNGFFHPDNWTFGQELRESQIMGRIQSIQGIDHVLEVIMRRWNEATPGTDAILKLRPNEIIQVKNDADNMENGFIFFDVRGGRK